MKRMDLEDVLEKVGNELDKKIIENEDFFPNLKRTDIVLIGGYALDVYEKKYDIDLQEKRYTNDVDFYAVDAKLFGDRITPTGASIELSDYFKAEFFDWISGMDHKKFDIDEMCDYDSKIKSTKKMDIYVVSPAIFVINKLLSYRQDKSREKDLKDVAKLYNEFKKNDYKNLTDKIDENIKNFGLQTEFNLIEKYIQNLNS